MNQKVGVRLLLDRFVELCELAYVAVLVKEVHPPLIDLGLADLHGQERVAPPRFAMVRRRYWQSQCQGCRLLADREKGNSIAISPQQTRDAAGMAWA